MGEREALELKLKQSKDKLDSSYSDVSLHSSITWDSYTVLTLLNKMNLGVDLFVGSIEPEAGEGTLSFRNQEGGSRDESSPSIRRGQEAGRGRQ